MKWLIFFGVMIFSGSSVTLHPLCSQSYRGKSANTERVRRPMLRNDVHMICLCTRPHISVRKRPRRFGKYRCQKARKMNNDCLLIITKPRRKTGIVPCERGSHTDSNTHAHPPQKDTVKITRILELARTERQRSVATRNNNVDTIECNTPTKIERARVTGMTMRYERFQQPCTKIFRGFEVIDMILRIIKSIIVHRIFGNGMPHA